MSTSPPGGGAGFKKTGEREIHRGHIITVVEGEFSAPDGQPMLRDIVRHPGAVSIVPIDGDEVILVRQYRAAAEKELLEIPAGKRDVADEPPEVTAVRELEEEIGFTSDSVQLISTFYNSVGFSDEFSYIYLATDLRPVTMRRDGVEEEWMSIERFPIDKAVAMIDSGEIEDAKTIVGLLQAQRHRKK